MHQMDPQVPALVPVSVRQGPERTGQLQQVQVQEPVLARRVLGRTDHLPEEQPASAARAREPGQPVLDPPVSAREQTDHLPAAQRVSAEPASGPDQPAWVRRVSAQVRTGHPLAAEQPAWVGQAPDQPVSAERDQRASAAPDQPVSVALDQRAQDRPAWARQASAQLASGRPGDQQASPREAIPA